MAVKLSRQEYCEMFGPTVGDKIHLADTGLIAEIEKDYAADCYGDEILFGGGKTDRDGMGNMSGKTTEDGVLDVCVTNAIIIDPMLGVIKGDILSLIHIQMCIRDSRWGISLFPDFLFHIIQNFLFAFF